MEVFVPSQILLRYLLVFSGHLLQPLVCVYAIYLENKEGLMTSAVAFFQVMCTLLRLPHFPSTSPASFSLGDHFAIPGTCCAGGFLPLCRVEAGCEFRQSAAWL